MITEVKDYTDFKILGRTRDDAAGEALDKAARTLGLDYPGGVNLDKIAKTGIPTHINSQDRTLTVLRLISAFRGLRLR